MNIYEQKLDPSKVCSCENDGWEDMGPRAEPTLEMAVFNFLQDWNTQSIGQFTWLTLLIAPHIRLIINQTTGTMFRFVDLDAV